MNALVARCGRLGIDSKEPSINAERFRTGRWTIGEGLPNGNVYPSETVPGDPITCYTCSHS